MRIIGYEFIFYFVVFYRFCPQKSDFIVETGHALSLHQAQKNYFAELS
jgi:hypothetical protein